MSTNEELDVLLEAIQDDCYEWRGIFGRKCLRIMRRHGDRAVAAIAYLMEKSDDNQVKLHCSYLLNYGDTPEAADAVTSALERRLDDEVLEQIFEDAIDSDRMKTHAGFITKARALYERRPIPAIHEFLSRIDGGR